MNKISISKPAKIILSAGTVITFTTLFASAIAYIGAGRFLDYYPAMDISAQLLESVRSCGVITMAGGIITEYFKTEKSD